MSARRNMAMGLTNYIWKIIDNFKLRTPYTAYEDNNSQQYRLIDNLNKKNLLSTATLHITPNSFLTGKIEATIPTNGNGDLLHSRGSLGYRMMKNGFLEATSYMYNQLAPSTNFTGGAASIPWAAQGLGGGWLNGQPGFDGTSTGVILRIGTQTTRNDYGGTYIRATASAYTDQSFETNELRTLLFYTKISADENFIGIQLATGASGFAYNNNANLVKINLSTPAVVNMPTSYTASVTIKAEANGWYKIAVSSQTPWSKFMIHSSRDVTNQWVTTGNSPYFWGFHVADGIVGVNYKYFQTSTARANIPRIDYSLGEPVILLEPSKINLCIRSDEFDNVAWTKTGMSVTPNTTASPEAFVKADTLTATSSNAQIRQNGATNNTASGRIVSLYVKRKTGTGDCRLEAGRFSTTFNPGATWSRIQVVDTTTTGTYSAVSGAYDVTTTIPHGLTTGDAIAIAVNANLSIPSVTVVSPTNITFTIGTSTASGAATIYTNHIKIYINNSGDEIYAWGAQIETRQNFTFLDIASTYIPTIASSVTRSNDAIAINNLVSNGIFGTDWSIFFNIRRIGGSNSAALHIVGISNTTNVDYFGIIGVSSGVLASSRRENNGTATTVALPIQPPESSFFKVLITMNAGTGRIWVDGVLCYQTTFTTPANLLQLFTSANQILMIKEIAAWNYCLSNSQIFELYKNPTYFVSGITISYELQAIVNRAFIEGFTIPNNTVLQYIDTMITNMKNNSLWNNIDCFHNYGYNNVALENFSRICWKNPNGQLATFNGGYTYKTTGFAGNGSNAYIDTKFNSTLATFNFVQNNAGRFVVISEAPGTISVFDSTAGGTTNYMIGGAAPSTSSRINAPGVLSSTFFYTSTTGIKSIMRDSSTAVRLQDGNTLGARTQTSGATTASIANGTQWVLSGVGGLYAAATATCYYIGASLSDSQISNFRTNYNTFLTNLGLTPVA